MKKMILVLLILIITSVSLEARERQDAPLVRYTFPKSESTVELTGKKNLTFRWKGMPIPSGGRRAYKFTLYKGFGYEEIFDKILDFQVYSIDVPADKFENGVEYTWQVKQRSKRSGHWGKDNRWSFKIERGKKEKFERLRSIQKGLNRLNDERIDEKLEKNIP